MKSISLLLVVALGTYAHAQHDHLGIEDPKLAPGRVPALQTTMPKLPALQTTMPKLSPSKTPDTEATAVPRPRPRPSFFKGKRPIPKEPLASVSASPSPALPRVEDEDPVESNTPLPLSVAITPFKLPLSIAPVQPSPTAGPAIDPKFACDTHDDCVIKDARNCCGYYPKCANKNAVMTRPSCAGMMGVCGFPSLSGCQCSNGQCVGLPGSGTGAGEVW